jgi:N-formylmaleamate deformylase
MTAFRTCLLVAATACGAAPPAAPVAPPTIAAAAVAAPAPRAFRVEVTGHGPPMILIPGLSSSGDTWTTTVAHLRDRYTCHVVTLAGFAGVPPIEAPLLPSARAELASYIAARHLAKPVIVGHSLGGELALMLASDHPDAVGPIVIVDSLPFLGGVLGGAGSVEEARPIAERIRAGMAGMPKAQYDAYLRSGQATNGMAAAPADQQRIIAWGLASDRATVGAAIAELFTTDLRPSLPKITAPALVIGTWIGLGTGEAARAESLARFRAQYAGLPRLHFAMTDTARHFVMFDDLPWLTRQLDQFLADPDAGVSDRGFPAL